MVIERTCVGLDVHARSVVAAAIETDTGELHRRRMGSDSKEVLAWIGRLPGPVRVVYEAGPTGFGLARFLTANGVECVVAAPSKLQRPAGDRVKTDSRDALHLAQLLRLGQIAEVTIPSRTQEAARDLVRAREDCRGDLMSARHRVSKLLLRHGIVYDGSPTWNQPHNRWLSRQRFEIPGSQLAFESAYEAVVLTLQRRERLDEQIAAMAADSEFTDVVRRLNCLRGVSTLTGFGLAVEVGDWHRFTGSTIGSFLGLVPTEYSSGSSRSQGSITKTGNSHARRLLVEAAWHHRRPYRPSIALRARWELAPVQARARGHEGNWRLHKRWMRFVERKKRPTIATVAIARELAGWCWSLAVLE
ncbi:MAG: IS110 family transposase [Candidatus Nanopelagicales bacterium]|nr:IS110 family transposase [Candidatus Nanopelagicales bacterium]MDZ4248708.1 IS110 family transposase [Candidatus Nanopelagicales bacterium]